MRKTIFCLNFFYCIVTITLFPINGKATSLKGILPLKEFQIYEKKNVFQRLVYAEATGIVKERMMLMKSYARSMKILNAALSNISAENLEIIKIEVNKLVKESGRLLHLFPVGSGEGVSEASSRIWEQPGEFAKRIRTFSQTLQKLAEATDLNSQKALIRAFRKVGGACKGCHQDYREKKRR